jgi:plasmid stabilization system protein ParE
MAFRIIWTGSAREDLKAVVKYIKSDNPEAAESFGFRLIKEAESVAAFPRRGRVPQRMKATERKWPTLRSRAQPGNPRFDPGPFHDPLKGHWEAAFAAATPARQRRKQERLRVVRDIEGK